MCGMSYDIAGYCPYLGPHLNKQLAIHMPNWLIELFLSQFTGSYQFPVPFQDFRQI